MPDILSITNQRGMLISRAKKRNRARFKSTIHQKRVSKTP